MDLQEFCRNYITSYKDINLYFKNKNISSPILIANALFYTNVPDISLVDKINTQINQDDNLIPFRDNFQHIYSYIFSNYSDYENIIYDTLVNIELFNSSGIENNEFIAVAAFLLATKSIDDYDEYIDRTIQIYNHMNKTLGINLTNEDYVYSALISILYRDLDDIFSELSYMSYVVDKIGDKNLVKYLMSILILKEADIEEKANTIISLQDLFKKDGFNYKSAEDMSFLAFFSFFDFSKEELLDKLKYFYDFLNTTDIEISLNDKDIFLFSNLMLCQYYFIKKDIYSKNNSKNLSSLILAQFAIVFILTIHSENFFK